MPYRLRYAARRKKLNKKNATKLPVIVIQFASTYSTKLRIIDGWMTCDLMSFSNSSLVISKQWKRDNERLYVMEL